MNERNLKAVPRVEISKRLVMINSATSLVTRAKQAATNKMPGLARAARNYHSYLSFKWGQATGRPRYAQARPLEMLLLSAPGNSHGLCYPFHRYRKLLYQELGLQTREIEDVTLSGKRRAIERFKGDIVLFSPPLRDASGKACSREEVRKLLMGLPRREGQKIVFFDVADGPVGRHFDCAPFVDLYAIPYTFADPANYQRSFLGANIFADFVSRHYGLESTKSNAYWPEVFASQLDPAQTYKLFTAHRIGFRRRLFQLYEKQHHTPHTPQSARQIDVHCRFQSYGGWCRVHRFHVRDLLHELAPRFHIIATENKVPYSQYCAEVNNAKIVVSPFGWGEFCPKDWEAFIMGALLIKPSVEHLNHFPRLFVPYETYVPVRWDLSDLKETIVYYLENEAERLRIVANATATVKRFYEGNDFVDLVQEMLQRLGQEARGPASAAAEHVSNERALR